MESTGAAQPPPSLTDLPHGGVHGSGETTVQNWVSHIHRKCVNTAAGIDNFNLATNSKVDRRREMASINKNIVVINCILPYCCRCTCRMVVYGVRMVEQSVIKLVTDYCVQVRGPRAAVI